MPVLAKIEVIWVIIIVFSVIAQIVKGIKKVSAQAPGKKPGSQGPTPPQPASQTGKDFVAPDQALREFLQNLSGYAPSPTPMPSVPAPPPQSLAQQNQRRIIKPPSHFPAAPGKRPSLQAQPTKRYIPTPTPAASNSYKEEAPPVMLEILSPTPAIALELEIESLRKELSTPSSARKAIIMREILGPPLAFR